MNSVTLMVHFEEIQVRQFNITDHKDTKINSSFNSLFLMLMAQEYLLHTYIFTKQMGSSILKFSILLYSFFKYANSIFEFLLNICN